jgi:hypothetical protein
MLSRSPEPLPDDPEPLDSLEPDPLESPSGGGAAPPDATDPPPETPDPLPDDPEPLPEDSEPLPDDPEMLEPNPLDPLPLESSSISAASSN